MERLSNLQPSSEAHDRAKIMWDYGSDGLSLHTPYDWNYIDVNKTGLDMMGYTANEVIGRPAFDFFHPDDAAAFRAKRAKILYKEGIYTKQYRIRHKDGHYFWIESTHRSIRDKTTGELLEIVCISRDITARLEAQSQIHRLADVVQSSSDLVVFFDDTFRIDYANTAASEFVQSGAQLEALVGARRFAEFKASVIAEVKKNGRWLGHLRFRYGLDGARIGVIRQVVSTNPDGNLFSLMAMDITDLLQAEEEIKRHRTKVAELSRSLAVGEVSTVLAHEVNQPLGAIMNYAQGTLRRISNGTASMPDDIENALQKIVRQADRAGSIIKSWAPPFTGQI